MLLLDLVAVLPRDQESEALVALARRSSPGQPDTDAADIDPLLRLLELRPSAYRHPAILVAIGERLDALPHLAEHHLAHAQSAFLGEVAVRLYRGEMFAELVEVAAQIPSASSRLTCLFLTRHASGETRRRVWEAAVAAIGETEADWHSSGTEATARGLAAMATLASPRVARGLLAHALGLFYTAAEQRAMEQAQRVAPQG